MSSAAILAEQIVKVSNTTAADTVLWIEPLGDCVPMPRGETFEIIATSELGHEVEIELLDDAIRVYGWIRRISSLSVAGERKSLWELAPTG